MKENPLCGGCDDAVKFIRDLLVKCRVAMLCVLGSFSALILLSVGTMWIFQSSTAPMVCFMVSTLPLLAVEFGSRRRKYMRLQMLLFRVEKDVDGSIVAARLGGEWFVKQRTLDFQERALRIIYS